MSVHDALSRYEAAEAAKTSPLNWTAAQVVTHLWLSYPIRPLYKGPKGAEQHETKRKRFTDFLHHCEAGEVSVSDLAAQWGISQSKASSWCTHFTKILRWASDRGDTAIIAYLERNPVAKEQRRKHRYPYMPGHE